MRQNDGFTIVDVVDERRQARLGFIHGDGKVELSFIEMLGEAPDKPIQVSKAQLGELGVLFLALAGGNFDPDDAYSLLEGIKLPIPHCLDVPDEWKGYQQEVWVGPAVVRWREDVNLEVVHTFDEKTDHAETSNEIMRAGLVHEVDIVEEKGHAVDIQFGDGSMAFGVHKDFFERI